MESEEPTLFHFFKIQKRRAAKTIHRILDPLGNIHEAPKGIIQTFAEHLKERYSLIEVDARGIEALIEAVLPTPLQHTRKPWINT
jgi:hypothetical protein